MKINEVAKLTGITVRTLHYYDEIGLLMPSETTEAGYRIYDEESLTTLQQILFFRELDFSLSDIKQIMTNPDYDKAEALRNHKELLLKKRSRIDGLITLLEHTIKGEKTMEFKEFDMADIKAYKEKYAAEVNERWGQSEAYKESEKKIAAYNEQQWKAINEEGAEILKAFGDNRSTAPDNELVQKLVERWQAYITNHFYECKKEILACLSLMYVTDERFTKNIDENGEGTAQFMADAIEIYCR